MEFTEQSVRSDFVKKVFMLVAVMVNDTLRIESHNIDQGIFSFDFIVLFYQSTKM